MDVDALVMHRDQAEVGTALVRSLVAAQFPRWRDLPVTRVRSAGTVNAVFRLGGDLAVRLPLTAGGAPDVLAERRWLPVLAPHLPCAVPEVLGAGEPGPGYRWPWNVVRWIDGRHPRAGAAAGAERLARDLAAFATALRAVDPAGGPAARRGLPLAAEDAGTRDALARLDALAAEAGDAGGAEDVDTAAATAAWEESLRAPRWTGPPVWVHGDLMPGNLLLTLGVPLPDGRGGGDERTRDERHGGGTAAGSGGRLGAVIDFGTAGTGDPACDLIPAWNLLPRHVRGAFREAAGPDDATWLRGRGRALSMALAQLPYYRRTNPDMAANARHVVAEVLADHAAGGR